MNLSITPHLEVSGSGFIASWSVTEDWGYGETEKEAVKDLVLTMVESLDLLENENLGPLMNEKLELLRWYVHTTSTGLEF